MWKVREEMASKVSSITDDKRNVEATSNDPCGFCLLTRKESECNYTCTWCTGSIDRR